LKIHPHKMIPTAPKSFLSLFGINLKKTITDEMDAIQKELGESDERRDEIYRSTREIFRLVAKAHFEISIGNLDVVEIYMQETSEALKATQILLGDDPLKREGNLDRAVENFTEARLLHQFFLSGKLVSLSAVQPCTDEEYMSATLGVAQHLARYCVGRACEADTHSISICRSAVSDLMEIMLKFDFRNGPLRRKYDGLKYALKKLETITYELSVLEGKREGGEITTEPVMKKPKYEETSVNTEVSCIDSGCFDEIRIRMEAYDGLRERVIKGSRDVQKLSKQSIFSVHRGKLADARKQLDEATAAAKPLHAIVAEHPSLRYGAFSNSLEEWAEGALFIEWVERNLIMPKVEMAFMSISTNEYIGALSDFTGEIGRLAVIAASKRDMQTVGKIHNCVIVIAASFQQLNSNGKFNKKYDAISGTLRKIEDVVYEMTLVRSGREKVVDEIEILKDD
jgi:predicted translin family RNA/ssDNA-binding protein